MTPLMAILLLASAVALAIAHEADDSWVAKVNGEPVSAGLLQRRIMRDRAHAYRYFREKYGAADSQDFWTASYGEEMPLEWIRQRALGECVRIKVAQTLAREKGVIQDITYAAFLQNLEKENERRSKALAAGEPIYGPQQYREDEYFTYVFTNMVIELKRRLSREELYASEEALKEHYEAIKDELYDRRDRVVIRMIEIEFRRREGESEGASREQARAKIEEAKSRLDGGERFEELAAEYNEKGSLHERTLDDESARFDDRMCPELRGQAMKLSEGETSGIFEERGAFYIVKCIEREKLGYMPFEEVRASVKGRYIDGRYEELVAALVKSARVEINPSVYEQIGVS